MSTFALTRRASALTPQTTTQPPRKPFARSRANQARSASVHRAGIVDPTTSDLVSVQTKPKLGRVDDPLEREADRVADQVVSTPRTADIGGISREPLAIQQACKACEADDEDAGHVRRKNVHPGNDALVRRRSLPDEIWTGLGVRGSPLPARPRADMEMRFERSFSHVNIHRDSVAGGMAASLNARAFTVGRDIYFGAGEFRPETPAGAHLLAHELTHVLQQGSGASSTLRRSPAVESPSEGFQKRLQMATEPGHRSEFRAAVLLQEIYYEDNVLLLYDAASKALPAVEWQKTVRAIVEEIELDDVKKLASYADGQTVIRMLLRDAHASPEERLRPSSRRKKGYDDYLVDGPLLGVGGLAEAPFRAMAAEDFKDEWVNLPSPHWAYACMKKVNFNIETVFQGETDALDPQGRPVVKSMHSKAAGLAKGEDKRNSHNMEALVAMGRGVFVGFTEWSRQSCLTSVAFSLARYTSTDSDEREDPFTLEAADVMFRPKSPVQMLLDSTRYADKGIYMFVMSPEMHHSASLMLIKRKGGELVLGSPDYSVYWNDQYEDDGGSIGRAVTDQIIASRLFELTEPRFSDPLDVKSGMSGFATQPELDASTYKADLGSPGREGRKLRTRAAQQRCSNLVGMPIWRIVPL